MITNPLPLSSSQRLRRLLLAHAITGRLCATQTFSGGVFHVMGTWFLQMIALLVQLAVWRALLQAGADTGGLTVAQVLTYVTLSSCLAEQLQIVSPASTAFWEGTLANRYTRPLSVISQLIAETMGRWLPHLLFFSLPVLLVAPLAGVHLRPASTILGWAFAASLVLAISLGFSMDLLFAALAIHIPNAGWMAIYIRNAVFTLFSGALIPFRLLPWGLGSILEWLPFGSLAAAPLSLFTGMGSPAFVLGLQLLWNVILWPVTLLVWKHSEERMVAYGG